MPPFSTDPKDWFLTPAEIGHRGISAHSSGNRVMPFIEAEEYMKAIFDLLHETDKGDFIHIVDWQLDTDAALLGAWPRYSDGNPKPDSTVKTVLANAVKHNVDVRVLLSSHTTSDNPTAALDLLKDNISCVLDARNAFCGSSHQKFAVIFKGASKLLHAFCGGIDLAKDRWDNLGHTESEERQVTVSAYRGGWHDVHCHIFGPAAEDLELTFRERWNDPSKPNSLSPVPPPIVSPIPPQDANGPHHVQVLRTYPCQLKDAKETLPFAPRGEFTARLALLKAIKMARELIYIEDQYFISYEVAEAIRIALALQPNLYVIVVVPDAPDNAIATYFMNFHQSSIINYLRSMAGDRFAIYYLRNPIDGAPIYVHAKLAIVDDVWVENGSMNLNRRSMANDKEIAIAVVDSTLTADQKHCEFARNLRRNLWAAHIDMPVGGVADDPKDGFEQWATRSTLSYVRAKPHSAPFFLPSRPAVHLANDFAYCTFIDPQSLCRGAGHIPP